MQRAVTVTKLLPIGFCLLACGGAPAEDANNQEESALSAGCAAVSLAEQALRCDAPPPEATPEGFRHEKFQGTPRHRGRDMFFQEGEAQTIVAKFAYGLITDRLTDEDIDVFILRSCGTTWKKLERVRTSNKRHSDRKFEGFEDDEGRLIYDIPPAERLPVGRHRVRLVAAGDGSATELFIEVVPRGTKLAVIDIDGTLNMGTLSEVAYKLFDGQSSIRAGAPEVLRGLAKKGYRPFYLTARADLDADRTREFIRARELPEGIIHTTHLVVGLFGRPAAAFKVEELDFQKQRGLEAAFGFGNQKSDADAYDRAGIPSRQRFFFEYDDTDHGGRRIDSYETLIPEITALDSTCPAR